jgi:hypothetical protein
MMRFFFDYTMKGKSLRDYRGEEFQSSKGAIDFAEAAVQILNHSLAGDWIGWSLEVRNAEGRKFLSVPVRATGMSCPHRIPF